MATTWKAPTWRMPNEKNQSKFENYGLTFDGSNEYVSTTLTQSGTLSVSCWFYTDDASTQMAFFGAGTTYPYQIRNFGLQNGEYVVGVYTKDLTPNFQGIRYDTTAGSASYTTGQWTHFVGIIEKVTSTNANYYLYENGVLKVQTNDGYREQTTYPFFLGAMNNFGTATQKFNGKISNVTIFDYAISSTQISSLYNSGSPINPMTLKPAPIAYYPLGGNASTGGDSSNTLSVPNIAVPDASVFDFDRSTQDEILIDENNDKLFQGVSAFTVSAWVKLKTNTGYDHGVVGNDGVSTRGFYMTMKNSPQLRFFVSTTGTTFDAFTYTNPTSTLNRWLHYVVIWDGSNMDMYIDGMYSQTQACVNATGTFTAPVGTVIGGPLGQGGPNKYYFDGEINNVQIWYQRLSHGTASVGDVAGGDIATLYNSGVPLLTGTQPQESNLKAWWKLNQSANWEADAASTWQIPDNRSAYPQSFKITSNDSIDFPIGLLSDLSAFTISFWYNRGAANGTTATLLEQNGVISINQYRLSASYSGLEILLTTVNGQSNILSTSQGNVPTGEWLHVGIVYDGSNMTLYRNGSQAPGTYNPIAATGNTVNNNNVFEIFAQSFLQYGISNLQVWGTNLPATGSNSIQTLYNDGIPLTSAIVTDHLKGWWKLDNTEFYDTFNTTNKWMINNNLSTSFNKCFWMNPLGIQVSSTLGYQDGTTAFSGAAWVNISSGNCPIISRQRGRLSSGTYPGWTFGTTGSGLAQGDPQFKLHTNTNGAINVKSLSNTFQDGKWHFLAFTYDGSQDASGVKLYVDGYEDTNRQVLQNNLTGIMSDYNTPFMIGGSYNSYLNNRYGTNQFMSNAMYFESELSASNILTLYNNGIPLNDLSSFTTVKGWWKLDDTATYGTGWTVPDASGNGNTGTSDTTMPITNRVDFIPAISSGVSSGMTEQNLVNNNVSALNGESSGMDTSNLVTSTLTRQVPYNSYSLNFDSGNPDKITGTGALISGNESRSFSLWYKTSSTVAQIPFSLGSPTDQTNGAQFAYCINRSSTTNAAIFGKNSAYDTSVFTVPNTSDGNWHHLVVTYNQSALNVYIDGNLEATPALPSTSYITSAGFTIGGWTMVGNRPFDGELSNISVFNEALTSTEILKIYNSGVPGDLSSFNPSPIAWWSLGSDSYYNGANYICPDLIGTNNGTSSGMGANALIGDAPNSIANGTSTNMAIDANLTGNAPNSSNNSFSVNMSYDDRETSVPS